MKERKIKSFLMLIALVLIFASCEQELIVVDYPAASIDARGVVNRGNGEILSGSISQPALTPPANPALIKAGEKKSAGNVTIANVSRYPRIVNLSFTFMGAGAGVVDSVFYTSRGLQEVKVKVVDNKFTINSINVPANTFTDIRLIYKLVKTFGRGVNEGAQITLSLTGFSTDEAGVNLPNSGRFPNPINLDKVSLASNDNGGTDPDNGDDDGDDDNDDGDGDDDGDTTLKPSAWFGEPIIGYTSPFAIIGNTVSNELVFKINSSSPKTFKSLIASFGENGKAIKMLRYSLNGGAWKVLSANNGQINFENISLKAGENIFKAYFSLKSETGVANDAPLYFSFIKLDDGEGGTVFSSGKFVEPLNVGSVNSSIQATVVKTGWFSYLRTPGLIMDSGSQTEIMIHVIQLLMTGPAPAKISSVKFVNPYSAFNAVNGNDFRFSENWSLDLNDAGRINFDPEVSNQNTFTVSFPEKDIPTNGNYQRISIFANVKNIGNRFNSEVYTPGKFGLKIASKYDIVIKNASGQTIDLSDVNIWQDGQPVN